MSQSGVPEEGACARMDPVPGLCTHLDQPQSHLPCLEEPLPVLRLTHRQEHRAHQHAHCTTRSMLESWETSSSEVVFLLKEPPPCLLQPETGGTASQPSLSLLLEPSLRWTTAVSINPGVRETEQQFKNVKKKKIAHPFSHPTARMDQPQHNALQPHRKLLLPMQA